jgi:outer membrane lipopolysaccharide assembly protein LptE/RlpB
MVRYGKLLSFFAVLILVGGCGYRFTGEGAGPRPGLKYIAIPVFENSTTEPDLGALFAGALRREFMQKGPLHVAPLEQAEAIFRGHIKDAHTSAVAHHDAQLTIETRIYITLDIRCVDVKTGNVLWKDPNFTYFRVYLENAQPIVAFDNRREALELMARETAIRIHDRFLSNF